MARHHARGKCAQPIPVTPLRSPNVDHGAVIFTAHLQLALFPKSLRPSTFLCSLHNLPAPPYSLPYDPSSPTATCREPGTWAEQPARNPAARKAGARSENHRREDALHRPHVQKLGQAAVCTPAYEWRGEGSVYLGGGWAQGRKPASHSRGCASRGGAFRNAPSPASCERESEPGAPTQHPASVSCRQCAGHGTRK